MQKRKKNIKKKINKIQKNPKSRLDNIHYFLPFFPTKGTLVLSMQCPQNEANDTKKEKKRHRENKIRISLICQGSYKLTIAEKLCTNIFKDFWCDLAKEKSVLKKHS